MSPIERPFLLRTLQTVIPKHENTKDLKTFKKLRHYFLSQMLQLPVLPVRQFVDKFPDRIQSAVPFRLYCRFS